MLFSMTVIVGTSFGFLATKLWGKYCRSSNALNLLKNAQCLQSTEVPAGLIDDDNFKDNKIVIIRGRVRYCSHGFSPDPEKPLSNTSSVIFERTQKFLPPDFDGAIGVVRWTLQLFGAFINNNNNLYSYYYSARRFELAGQLLNPSYTTINLDGSSQPFPLTLYHRQLHTLQLLSSPFLQALFGETTLLEEVKILPVGKTISVVGTCRKKCSRETEIKSCNELPYFLSDMTKTEMVADLTAKTDVLFRNAILMGSVSLGVLAYAAVRKWWRWKERRCSKRHSHEPKKATEN